MKYELNGPRSLLLPEKKLVMIYFLNNEVYNYIFEQCVYIYIYLRYQQVGLRGVRAKKKKKRYFFKTNIVYFYFFGRPAPPAGPPPPARSAGKN